ncbi:MAG: zinc ribbon domain-containing protein, partial [Thermoplasmata archaeon]
MDGDSRKCGLCGAELETGSDVCPNCGADLSLLDLDDSEGLDAIRQSTSLDDLLAMVLDEPSTATPPKEESGKSLEDLDLDLEIPDEPVEKPTLDLDVLEEDLPSSETAEAGTAVEPEPSPEVEVPTKREDGVRVATPTGATALKADLAVEPPREGLVEDEGLTYECPECGAKVAENAPMCFSCGALFSEEAHVCPECGAEVASASTQCPQCGVQFAQEGEAMPETPTIASQTPEPLPLPEPEIRHAPGGSGDLVRTILDRYENLERQPFSPSQDPRELQRSLKEYVIYLRSLLILAKAVHVPTDSIQLKVSDATRRARAQDLDGAVRMAHSAKLALEQSLSLQVAKRIEMLQADLANNRSRGMAYPVAEDLVQRAVTDVDAGRVQSAFERLDRAKEDMAASSGGQNDARHALQTAKEMVEEIVPLGLAADELQTSLAQGEQALRQGNWEAAAQMASSVQERATETLQDGLSGEMKRMREQVM